MKRLALCLMLLTAGCKVQPPAAPPAPDVAQLQAQHLYVEALAALDINSPDYDDRRAELLAAAAQYKAQLLQELGELTRLQQFAEARRMLATARPHLPESNELNRFAENLDAAAARFQQRQLDEIVILRSNTLLKEQALYRSLHKAADSPELEQLIARQAADAEFFAAQLAQLGTRALAQNELSKATLYLGHANQLAPSDELAQQLKRAEQALATSKQKRLTARSTEREQHYKELTAALQQSMQQRDYATARLQIEQLKALNIRVDEVESAQEQLDRAIAAFVARQLDTGNRLYSDGHLEEALQHWRRAAALEPSPQLTERMEKAQRFIDRLEQLRAKQD